jgi:hypothetical protein
MRLCKDCQYAVPMIDGGLDVSGCDLKGVVLPDGVRVVR